MEGWGGQGGEPHLWSHTHLSWNQHVTWYMFPSSVVGVIGRKEREAQSWCHSYCRGRGGWELQGGGRRPLSQQSRGPEFRPQVTAPSQDPGAAFQPTLAHLPAWAAKRQKS